MIVWVPCVLIGIWATSNLIPAKPPLPSNPNAILPFLVKTQTGPLLGGLLAAGILAAIMSSLDSQFLCLGTIFSNDIVAHYYGQEKISDRGQIALARIFIVAIVAITYLLSLFPQRGVFNLGVWCFSGFASLFPLVFAALYWRRLSKAGAYASILTTIVVWSLLFFLSDFGANREFAVTIGWGEKVYETMPVATIFIFSLVAMIGVSLCSKPPSEQTIGKFFSTVSLPRGGLQIGHKSPTMGDN